MTYREKLLNYFRQRDRGWLLSLFMLVCLTYLPFLGNPFVFDDIGLFHNGGVASFGNTLFEFKLRWFPYASLVWTATMFSDALTHFFHVGNMLLHTGNIILLFYLLRGLLGACMAEQAQQRTIIWGAWLAALVFSAHPLAVYAVGYIIQRSILMATFFALVMQLAYLRALLTGRERWLILVVVAYFMAGFSKEHSMLMPAVLVAQHILLLRSRGQVPFPKLDNRALWLCWGTLLLIAVTITFLAKSAVGIAYEPMAAMIFEQQRVTASGPMLYLLSVMTQAGLFFKYLFLWILPNPAWMSVDMRESFVPVWTAWQGWLGVIAFVGYGMLAAYLLLRGGKRGLFGFALLYPWLLFLIEFSSIRVQEPFVLYRSYLWMPGMMLFFPLLLIKWPGRRMIFALGLVVLILLPAAWNRLWVFADNYRLWNDAALLLRSGKEAGSDRIFYNRGQAKAKEKKWEEAIADFERVVELSPQLVPVHQALGMAYVNSGHYQQAIAPFDAALALKPDEAGAYYGKGLALMGLHESVQAKISMERGCELGSEMACMMAGWSRNKK